MRPAVFSLRRRERSNIGWVREGSAISYYKNGLVREGSKNLSGAGAKRILNYYTLSFSYTFEHEDDTVFFAYSYPYTYSDLNEYLESL